MAIQPINFPMLGMDQTNPEFAGSKFMSDMISAALLQRQTDLANQENKTLLPYLEPQAKAALQNMQAQTNQKEAAVKQAQLMQKYIANILAQRANNSRQANTNQLAYSVQNGSSGMGNTNNQTTISSDTSNNATIPVGSNTNDTNNPFNLDYQQASLLSKYFGLAKPQIIDVNGTQLAISPFGNFPVAQGLTAYEKGRQTAMGDYAGKDYGKNIEAATGLQNQGIALDELINLANTDPEFKNVTGPVNSVITKWAGNPSQKQLLGQLQTASGEIMLQVAPSLKGSFTGRDQVMINEVKANPKTDFPDIFIGKLKAQKLISTVLQKRAELKAQYEQKNMTPLDAMKRAAAETPLSAYRSKIDQLIYGNQVARIRNKKTGETKVVPMAEYQKMLRGES